MIINTLSYLLTSESFNVAYVLIKNILQFSLIIAHVKQLHLWRQKSLRVNGTFKCYGFNFE